MKHILILCLLIICFSCEQTRTIDFDVPFEGEKLVIYSEIGNNFDSYLDVYKTFPYQTDSPDVVLEGIEATIYADGEPFFEVPFNQNIGKIEAVFEEDKTYTLDVIHEELSVLSEPINIPPKIALDSFALSFNQDSSYLDFSVYFKPGYHSLDNLLVDADFYENGQRIELSSSGLSIVESDSINDYTKASRLQQINTADADFQPVTIDKIVVKLYHYSPERRIFHESRGNVGNLGTPDSEPTAPISNVIDGYGYFGAVNVDSIVIEW